MGKRRQPSSVSMELGSVVTRRWVSGPFFSRTMTDATNIHYVEYCIDVHGQNRKITLSMATVREIGTGIFVNLFIFQIRKI